MFSQEKLAVLESKLSIYEDLSREMLTKLENAVDKISEGNSRIATILAKHDQQLEQGAQANQLLIKMIDENKDIAAKEIEKIEDKISNLDQKMDNLSKFRWQVGGVLTLAAILIGTIDIFIPKIIPTQPTVVQEVRK